MAPPAAAAAASRRTAGAWPRSSWREPSVAPTLLHDERDRVRHVRLHGAEAGREQRGIAHERGEAGDAAREAAAHAGAGQQERFEDRHARLRSPRAHAAASVVSSAAPPVSVWYTTQ